jgi:hypothetical protein
VFSLTSSASTSIDNFGMHFDAEHSMQFHIQWTVAKQFVVPSQLHSVHQSVLCAVYQLLIISLVLMPVFAGCKQLSKFSLSW